MPLVACTGQPAGREGFGPATNEPTTKSLFGRDRERERLSQLLDEARGDRGRLALVSGEAGIGKTSLVDDLARSAAAAGCQVLTGRCYDLSTTPPYGPWI